MSRLVLDQGAVEKILSTVDTVELEKIKLSILDQAIKSKLKIWQEDEIKKQAKSILKQNTEIIKQIQNGLQQAIDNRLIEEIVKSIYNKETKSYPCYHEKKIPKVSNEAENRIVFIKDLIEKILEEKIGNISEYIDRRIESHIESISRIVIQNKLKEAMRREAERLISESK